MRGIPLSGLLALVGFGLALWALVPTPAPVWLRPRWMQEKRLGAAVASLRRVGKAKQRRNQTVARRGSEYFNTQVIAGVSLAYPEDRVLNLDPGAPGAVPGLRLCSRFAVDTPYDLRPRARFLAMSTDLVPESPESPESPVAGADVGADAGSRGANSDERLGFDIEASLNGKTSLDLETEPESGTDVGSRPAAGTGTEARFRFGTPSGINEIMVALRQVVTPARWELVDIQVTPFAGVPGIMVIIRLASDKGAQ